MNRDYILNHIEDFSAQQLFDLINQGIVTLEDLRTTGNLDATKRRAIVNLQTQRDHEDDNAWNNARYTEQGCRDYLTTYPAGRHVTDARQQIDNLEQQHIQEQAEKQSILNKVRRNPNSFPPGMLREYLNDKIINRNDLINAGFPDEIIDSLNNIKTPRLILGKTPESIPDGYTEVYFWGMKNSGKTCALAAILSTAEKMGYLEIAPGPGYNYALLLKNIFSNRISFLPAGTPNDDTQYLPFALKKPDEKFSRSVSLIELSGEIFQCFLDKSANKPLTDRENTFNSLIRFLNSNNRKIHFFFVDYHRKNEAQEGYKQSDYLNAAATFFNDPRNNLFRKTTDAIYIVVTKSDLMDCDKKERVNHIRKYLQDDNFTAFVNSLRTKCRENSINAKRILGTHFALGKVYANQICVFEDETAQNIIDILIRRIAPKKESILDVFNK